MMADLNSQAMQRGMWWAMVVMALLITISSGNADGRHSWERPGCHKVGK